MRYIEKGLSAISVLCLLVWLSAAAAAQDGSAQWKPVEAAMGRNGQMQSGGVIRFGMPRSDMHVTVGNVAVKPGLALGSWAAFKGDPGSAMLMGDLVLAPEEVEPVMEKLEKGGVEITGVHNHLLGENPRVMYMHIGGHGNAVELAKTLHEALALTKTPAASGASPASSEPSLDTAAIDKIMGRNGKMNGGIYQVGVPRAEKISENGMDVPPSMGVATGINFQPLGNGRAATTGDFVLLGTEVNPVLRALRQNGIEVTAVHSHMLTEEPRLIFMHFWGEGEATQLARGLRAALDQTNSQKENQSAAARPKK